MASHSSIFAWEMDEGAWWAMVHGIAKSQTTEHTQMKTYNIF